MGPVPRGAACRAHPPGPVSPTVSSCCSAVGAHRPWEAASRPPHLHAAAPCVLAALHPHVTITETHSTGQVYCTVGFEPSSGSPSATVQLACGVAAACRAAPAMGRDTCTCSAWVGRHTLLWEAHALQSHRGCTQDPPSAQSLRCRSGRQPAARLAQAQFCAPALPGPQEDGARPRRPRHHQGPRSPVQSPGSCLREPCPQEAAELSRNRAWMAGWAWGPSELTGGLGSGPRRAPAPLPHPAPSVSVSGRGPGSRGPCPGPLTRPGCVGAASGVGARQGAQHKLSFVLTDARTHSRGGVLGCTAAMVSRRRALTQPEAFNPAL